MRLVSIMFVAAACGAHPKHIAKDADQPAPPAKSLYERLGGTPEVVTE
ncbi:MAG: hypothetical protein ABJE66_14205 [Deltaproteobacteria bacterium]